MNYGNIIRCDVANGIGIRTSLFVSGCRHHCKECFNPQTWSFTFGKPYTDETKQDILNSLKQSQIQGLTILGGEPFEPENQEEILKLVKAVKTECPNKNIWIYSGYTFEELHGISDRFPWMNTCQSVNNCKEILSYIDILVDGEFQKELYNIKLNYRGSSNQRIIDIPKTLQTKTLCEKTELY